MTSPYGTDVHNASAVRLKHRPDDGPTAVKAASQIHGENSIPGLIIHILELLLACNAGVVYQQCHMAEFFLCPPNHGLYLYPVRHIRLNTHGGTAFAPKCENQALRLLMLLQVINADRPSLPGEQRGNGRSDPA